MFDGADLDVQPLLVTPQMWPAFADRVHPHLAKMADSSGGRYLVDDVVRGVEKGGLQLWVALQGYEILCVMATEVIRYPQMSAMRCVGVVGHRPRRWMHLLAAVERVAKSHFGCAKMEALTTPRHGSLLTTGGWEPWHVLWEKRL